MITQQINLYQGKLRESMLFASASQLLILLLLMIFGIAGSSYLIWSDLTDLEQQSQGLKARQSTINGELAIVTAELNQRLPDAKLTNLIADITKLLRVRKKVMRFIESNQLGAGEGFSSYLESLSNLQVDDVWVDEILLSDSSVQIKGSALRAELIPPYFASFGKEAVFSGQRFQLFELSRDPETDWKVDFTIATEEAR
jgi:hypothetical protein